MDLPNEIWAEIVNRLDGPTLFEEAPLVSKGFYSLAKASKKHWVKSTSTKECFTEKYDGYILSFRTPCDSKEHLQNIKRIVKKQRGLKSITSGTKMESWGVPKILHKKDNELVEALITQKYLAVLDIRNVKFTSMVDFLMLRHFRYPESRQNFSAPWTEEELKKLLKSNKQLKVLGLPRVTPSTLNFLLKDPDLEEWRKKVKSLNIGGLKQNWIWPDPEINWRNLTEFQCLTSFTAGRVDKWFWAVLPSLAHLKVLKLDLTMDCLMEIQAVDETTIHSRVTRLVLYCNESLEWIQVSPTIRQKLFSFFPKVTSLAMECHFLNKPTDIAELFSDICQGLPWLKELFILLSLINNQTLDVEAAQKLIRPNFPHLEELIFTVVSEDNVETATAIQSLFDPVLQQLFHGTVVQLRMGENIYYPHDFGILQTWWSTQLEGKVADNCLQFAGAYPSWNKVNCFRALMRSLQLVDLEVRQDFVFNFYEFGLLLLIMATAVVSLTLVVNWHPLLATGAVVIITLWYFPVMTIYRKSMMSTV